MMIADKIKCISLFLVVSVLLGGCMYPSSQKAENSVPQADQVKAVEEAVKQFQEANGGLLPIKNQDADVPVYQKYPIDFQRLERFMPNPPGNAYESGGVFQYVLIDVETEPKVKIFDLRLAETIREYSLRVKMYMDNNEYLPYKEQISTYVFTLDHKKLGYDEAPVVKSPYTGNDLYLMIDSENNVLIDYTPDLVQALSDNPNDVENGKDIRNILVKESLFVPAYSRAYTVDENNQPVFLKD
ncbi:MAG: hypothetical protein ACI4XL_06985 [Bacillus sp. (in: firmicutes)]